MSWLFKVCYKFGQRRQHFRKTFILIGNKLYFSLLWHEAFLEANFGIHPDLGHVLRYFFPRGAIDVVVSDDSYYLIEMSKELVIYTSNIARELNLRPWDRSKWDTSESHYKVYHDSNDFDRIAGFIQAHVEDEGPLNYSTLSFLQKYIQPLYARLSNTVKGNADG